LCRELQERTDPFACMTGFQKTVGGPGSLPESSYSVCLAELMGQLDLTLSRRSEKIQNRAACGPVRNGGAVDQAGS